MAANCGWQQSKSQRTAVVYCNRLSVAATSGGSLPVLSLTAMGAWLPSSLRTKRGNLFKQMMLEQGQARVSARVGEKACADGIISLRAARAARRGLWTDPNFAPLPSENPGRIAGVRGQFALVEGKVLSVRESGATIYLNFGPRWTRDFTVTILKRHRRDFAAAGVDPKWLEGQQIRVRGWVEKRTGPVIEAAVPEQIELSE
jgi:hypothetical protein